MNILFVRHGETDWQSLEERGVRGWARSFAPLTSVGRVQIDVIANDYRLKEAEAILCSSYARALESAALLNRKLNKSIYVEYDLHEWLPNKDSLSDVDEQTVKKARQEFIEHTGLEGASLESTGLEHTEDKNTPSEKEINNNLPFNNYYSSPIEGRTWESLDEVRERALRALQRYSHLSTVIVVSHAVLIASIVGIQRYIQHAEIIPFELDFDKYTHPTENYPQNRPASKTQKTTLSVKVSIPSN